MGDVAQKWTWSKCDLCEIDNVSHLGYVVYMSRRSNTARKIGHVSKKDAMIRARTTPRLKKEAEQVLDHLGLSPSEAINLFYRQICLRHGLPFAVEIPNEITLATFKSTDANEELIHTENEDEFFEKLGI